MARKSNPNNKAMVKCKGCSFLFIIRKSVLKRGRGKFCRSECYKEYWVKNYASKLGSVGYEARLRNEEKRKSSKRKYFW